MRSILYIHYFIQVHYVHCSSLVEFFLHSSRTREPLGRSIQLLGHHHDHGNHWKPPDLYYNLCCLVIFFFWFVPGRSRKTLWRRLGRRSKAGGEKKIMGISIQKNLAFNEVTRNFHDFHPDSFMEKLGRNILNQATGRVNRDNIGISLGKMGSPKNHPWKFAIEGLKVPISLEMYLWCVQIIWVAWFSRIRLINESIALG